jgi:hypothetical protein
MISSKLTWYFCLFDGVSRHFQQYFSSLMLWVRVSIKARRTTLCDQVCQWFATGRWFFPGPTLSSTNKTDRHDITEILLKVAWNTIKQTKISCQFWRYHHYCPFSPLKSHVVIDEVFGAQKKCTQNIYDLCFWQFKRFHSVGNKCVPMYYCHFVMKTCCL